MSSPIQLNERIGSLDFIRGVAILGILAMNVQHFAYPVWGAFNPYVFGFESDTDTMVRFITYTLFDQKMMGLFTILFGAGFYLFVDRLAQKQPGLKVVNIYTRRLIWLFVFGVIHAYVIWPGDVLYHYAVLAFFLFAFRTWSVKHLAFFAAFLLAMQLYNSLTIYNDRTDEYEKYQTAMAVMGEERTAQDSTHISSWERRKTPKTVDDYAEEMEMRGGNFFDSYEANSMMQEVHLGKIFYSSILFRNFMMMIIGLIFIKSGILSNYKKLNYYWLTTTIVTLLGVGICVTYAYNDSYHYDLPVRPLVASWSYAIGPMVLSVGYLLLFNGLYQKFFSSFTFKPLSSVGKTAFSNYILQSVVCGIIFFGYGFNQYMKYNRTEIWGFVIAVWIFQITVSMLWLRNHKYGPLEWLWRRLTYGKEL